MIMTEPTRRELRNVTRLALQRLADDRHADADIRYRALAARAQLDGQAKPDLREPYAYRAHIQPGLWLTVDASRNILLEVRTVDEAELLAAYALPGVMGMINQLELARMARDVADEEADAVRRAGLADAEWGRRLAQGMGPGEDADSRAAAVAELSRAGLDAGSTYRVLRRAYGHLEASLSIDGWASQPGTVTYDREHGTYAVRVPAATDEAMAANITAELGQRDLTEPGPGWGARARWAQPPEPRGEV
jgi:hypothetical protein